MITITSVSYVKMNETHKQPTLVKTDERKGTKRKKMYDAIVELFNKKQFVGIECKSTRNDITIYSQSGNATIDGVWYFVTVYYKKG